MVIVIITVVLLLLLILPIAWIMTKDVKSDEEDEL